MIPTFPRFKPLELTDRPHVTRVTHRFEPYSDFSFGSLWCWDTKGTTQISNLNGNLVVRFKSYVSDDQHYGFLGDRAIVETTRTLLAYVRAQGLPSCLWLIPDAVVTADPRLRSAFIVKADPANFDYVCSVPEWVALSGKSYAKHRTRIRRCQRRYRLETRPLALDDPRTHTDILKLFDRWAETTGADGIERDAERVALRRLFASGIARHMSGCGLYESDTLRAFSIWEGVPRHRMSIHHFMKADRDCVDASLVLMHVRSQALLRAGCDVANIEQDLGIPGLATYKRSLRPCRFLAKYVISDEAVPMLDVAR